jgi:hypothetical protein
VKTSKPPAPLIKIGAGGLAGKIRAKDGKLLIPLGCSGEGACSGQATMTARQKGKKRSVVLAKGSYSIAAGGSTTLRLPLTKAGRRLLAKPTKKGGSAPRSVSGVLQLDDSGRPTTLTLKRSVWLSGGK